MIFKLITFFLQVLTHVDSEDKQLICWGPQNGSGNNSDLRGKYFILEHFSHSQNCIKSTNKIPPYVREYKKEYLFIRGIIKEFKY